MKKFLSMVTALCCTASLMAMLPASAQDRMETFIVIAMNDPKTPETYVISNTDGNTFWISAKSVAEFADGQYFTVGDVLNFSNLGWVSNAKAGTNHMWFEEEYTDKEKASVTRTGSIIENAEIAEFTVSAEDYFLFLKDDENSYWFYLDWGTASYWQPDKYEYDFLQDGDKVSCYTYEGKPYIMINETQGDYFQNYLYLGADGENSVLMDEAGQTYYLSTEKMNSYLLADVTPKFTDVLRFRNLVGPEYEMPLTPLGTIDLTLEEIPKKSAPAIAYHPQYVSRDSHHDSTKFEILSYDDNTVTLAQDGTQFEFRADFITDTFTNDFYYLESCLNHEALTKRESVYCLTWNGRPFIAVDENAKDFIQEEHLAVIGVDDVENPQKYYLAMGKNKPSVFTREELKDFLPEQNLQLGDILQMRNISIGYISDGHFTLYANDLEDRPHDLTVINTLETAELKTLAFMVTDESYVRVRNENNSYFSVYYVPEGFASLPAPDISSLNREDNVTCLMNDNIPVALYAPTVTATGDADGSGELDILDIITVNKAILGKENLAEDKISSVDFNGNGVPDADDALTMLKMLVGLI